MSKGAAIWSGAWRFTIVSLVAYGIWAFGPKMGAAVLYSLIAIAYVGLSGVLMCGLIEGPRPLLRWYLIFVPGFLLYAVSWCAGGSGSGGMPGRSSGRRRACCF